MNDQAGDLASYHGGPPVLKSKPDNFPGATAFSPISCLSLSVAITVGQELGEELEASL